ncbi:MAG: MscL family protein [Eubacterium sp.]|nr:MscL family protein [Eubacterium sp.]
MRKFIDKKAPSKCFITYLIIFVLLFFLCMLFPYSGDDWAWGSQIGLDRLSNWFDNYSGRYFGNLIVLALTRSNLLKSVAMSFCLTGIIAFVNKLTEKQKNGIFIISSLLIFMPVALLRQAVVWTSGFANYTTSIFLTLIYIYYVKNIYDENKPKQSPLAAVPLLILGAANTLIVEHLTLYNVVLAVYVIVFTIVKFKKAYIQHIAYFIGTVAGTLLMFSNSVYRSVADGSDSYRTIGKGGFISRAIDAFLDTIVTEGFINNFILNIFLAVVCLVIWLKVKDKLSKLSKFLGSMSIAVIIAFASSSLVLNIISLITNSNGIKPWHLLRYVQGAAAIAYIVAFVVFLFILPFEINKKVKLFFILGSTGCMIAPLLVVTPIGSRCFFASYVMMIYLAMELYSLFDENVKDKCAKISRAAMIITIAGVIYLFYIYATIAVCSNKRIEKAQQDAKAGYDVIEVAPLPYKDYVWCSDVDAEIWAKRFKLFYGIDENVQIKQISSSKNTTN